ncbi:Organic cation transporter protein [Chionoecetes opilio]|uniref:Organic cation transporter protein n=1 Tax=Chionoecetes opilio TaxID=41210 RepID=A0A8J4Y622_CHIOP|nr:Organic cation transporter protein [Chionoecetes opilio]
MEVLEPKWRTFAAFGINTVWGVTVMLYGGLGYLIRDWRILQTAATLPGLLILPALWSSLESAVCPPRQGDHESPLWLIVNGRPQEALQVFGKMARWHGVDLPPEAEMKKLVEEQDAETQNTTPNTPLWVGFHVPFGGALCHLGVMRLAAGRETFPSGGDSRPGPA